MTGDRYTSNPLDGPGQMAEEFREIKRRLSALEGAPLSGTNLTTPDQSGNTLVAVGNLPDGTRGLQIISAADGWDLVKMTTEGWAAPHLMGAPWNPTDLANVTSGTFVDTWAVTFGTALGPGVEVGIPWATGAGTTGELEVTSNIATNTTAQTLPAASSGFHFVRWLHGAPSGSGPLELRIKARRTAGANNVTVYPSQAWVQDPTVCTSGGSWF